MILKTNNPFSHSTTSRVNKLDVFVGKWTMEGQQYKGLFGPAAHIHTEQTYEWLEGGLFLIHRLKGNVGNQEIACVEIIGYEESSNSYPTHAFYNDGKTNEWINHEFNGIWTLTGNSQAGDKPIKVRCTSTFSKDQNTMTGKWEQLNEDGEWETFWDVKTTRTM
jgi:hypothetical protein